jgi:hypothetical protein
MQFPQQKCNEIQMPVKQGKLSVTVAQHMYVTQYETVLNKTRRQTSEIILARR